MVDFIKENLENTQLLSLVRDKVFHDLKEKIAKSESDNLSEISTSYFANLCENLEKNELLNSQIINSIIDGLNRAATMPYEVELYKILNEIDTLKAQISKQKALIKDTISKNYQGIEEILQNSKSDTKEVINNLKEWLLEDLELTEILKETSEQAFLTTIEAKEDIEDTAFIIAKNMVFQAISEGEFKKSRFIEISRIVISSAKFIANENKIYTKPLIKGAVNGSHDGVIKVIEKFKDSLKFAPKEIAQPLFRDLKELNDIEEDFAKMLQNFIDDEVSGEIFNEILQDEYNSYFAKFKRMTAEAREQISLKFDEMSLEDGGKELYKMISEKLKDLKDEISQKSLKFRKDFEVDKKIESLKNEITQLEKSASDKFSELKSSKLENAKKEAKKLGEKIYESAKNFINRNKK